MLVVGVIVQITLQAALNIAVVTNTIPNTGISLPFFSSGGTSLMMLLGEMGIVLSVSRQADAVTGMCKFCDGDFTTFGSSALLKLAE